MVAEEVGEKLMCVSEDENRRGRGGRELNDIEVRAGPREQRENNEREREREEDARERCQFMFKARARLS